ncbi:MAG: Fic family protein [Alphaproteobacteria bacterium]
MSWFAESSNRLGAALNLNTRELLELKALVSKLGEGQDEVRSTLRLVADKSANLAGTLSALDLISSSNFETAERANPVSARLDVSLILLFHRLTCFDLPARHVGRFRTTNVTIGNPRNPRLEDKPTPAPSEVKALTERLCAEWVAGYQRIRSAENERLPAVAKFHARLNEIHPFSDGNGKVSRAILMQQCLDLYGRANMSLMNKGGDYYAALREADEGNLRSLIAIISPVVMAERRSCPQSTRKRGE